MYDELSELIAKYKIIYNIDYSKSEIDNIKIVIDIISKEKFNLRCRFELTNLLKVKSINDFYQYNRDGKSIIQEFLSNSYLIEANYIIWDGYIPIEVVSYDYNKSILVDSKLFEEDNIGITKFKIYLDERIYAVYCEGNHPNLNSKGKFCLDSKITSLKMNMTNVENYVKPILGFINMNFAYYNESLNKVRGILANADTR